MSRRLLAIALREYRATALTPAFIFAVVLVPVLILGGILVIGSLGLLKSEKEALVGTVSVLDESEGGVVLRALQEQFSPEAQAAAREARMEALGEVIADSPAASSPGAAAAIAMLAGRAASIDVERADPARRAREEKDRLFDPAEDVLALVVAGEASIQPPGPSPAGVGPADAAPGDAAAPVEEDAESQGGPAAPADADDAATLGDLAASLSPGRFSVFVGRSLDVESRRGMERTIAEAIVEERYRRAGYDPDEVRRLGARPRAEATTVTAQGEAETTDALQYIVPMVFMMLLWISVLTSAQYLLMSTIEEKSSRVMEVLLSATSPTSLLIGKILGQGCVGLTVLVVYVALGLISANQVWPSVLSQLPFESLPWLVLYFLMAYSLFASLMAAIGSAVNDIREAQSLMGPIMMLLMFPMFLWFLILDNPNSALAVGLSYVPFTTPFVMILRMTSAVESAPMWQVLTTTIVGFAGVAAVAWAAVKIFRIGVLMYGKPPSFMGLLKWVRQG